jgi:putative ABC transport system ATP-binding protein
VSTPPPVIRLAGVSRVFLGPPDVQALRSVSLHVDAGEYVAIVGPSGSGKSTLLNLLGLLDRPTSGRYELDGLATSNLTEPQRTIVRARRIGFVFQDSNLLPHRAATENVVLGLLYAGVRASRRVATAQQALTRVGLAHRLWALPTTMSGGERQRVAIARALVKSPSLLLCDEPTGSLDSHTGSQVLDLLDDLNEAGVTTVVITHDPDCAARANRAVTIVDGRLHDGSLDA